jgi:hypothetical protein
MKGSTLVMMALVLSAACGDTIQATQVMIVIDADPAVRAQVDAVHLTVRAGQGDDGKWQQRYDETVTPGTKTIPWPMELALVPKGDDLTRVYEVTATALGTGGTALTTARAISGYRKGATVQIVLRFDQACIDRDDPCDAQQTCARGACVDAHVGVDSLKEYVPGKVPGGSSSGVAKDGGDQDTEGGAGPDGGGSANDAATPAGGDAGDVASMPHTQLDAEIADGSVGDNAIDAALGDAGPELNACGGTGPLRLSSSTWYATANEPGAVCNCSVGCTALTGVPKELVCATTPGDVLHCQACQCGSM